MVISLDFEMLDDVQGYGDVLLHQAILISS